MGVLDDLIEWLHNEGGNIGIHDATNTTRERREEVLQRLRREPGLHYIFVESVCTDQSILEANIRMKLFSPDYVGKDPEEALKDFRNRLMSYEKVYEALDVEKDDALPFIKLIDVGKRVLANRIHGYLSSQILFYLANYHIQPRTIWFMRHGESVDNVLGRIGGDAPLTPKVLENPDLPEFKLWTSSLCRTCETAQPLIDYYKDNKHTGKIKKVSRVRMLNEIYAGYCEGMTYNEIETQYPDEYAARQRDKLRYRYPQGGESYVDMIQRLKPIIIELEREQMPVVIVSHRAVIRTLMGYFMNAKVEDIPYINIKLHEVVCLKPTPYGCEEARFMFGEQDTVDGPLSPKR